MEHEDLEAQERAALSIGDRAAAAKARARIDDIAEARRDSMAGPVGGDPAEPMRD